MFNADDIIKLEKQWLRYKLKQRIKLPLFLITFLLLGVGVYSLYPLLQNMKEKEATPVVKLQKKVEKTVKQSPAKQEQKEPSAKTYQNNIPLSKQESNTTKEIKQKTTTDTSKITKVKEEVKKEKKPFSFTLEPTIQKNELFYSEGTLNFTPPYAPLEALKPEPLKQIQAAKVKKQPIVTPKEEEKGKASISISMKEVDTTTYLKEKFYSSSNIVFALMLAEEYYNNKEFKQSAKWSLTANDIDPSNDKSWYWFAKAKVKMGQKNDAIRTLKAYLRNNKSARLKTLLTKIEHGESK